MLALLIGVVACSTSVLFIKESTLDPIVLSALRLWVAAAVLAPLYLRARARHGNVLGSRAVLPGLVLALHFMTWIVGARLTPVVNSTLLVNLVPLVTPLLLVIVASERIGRREAVGTVVSLAGVALLVGQDYRLSPEHFLGDAVCFGSMLLFATYLVFGRRNRDVPSLWLYLVPLYTWAAVACSVAAVLMVDLPAQPWTLREVALAAGLGLVAGVVGHGLLNAAMKRFRGQVVSIANLGQAVSAGAMAVPLLGEMPPLRFYPAALLIVAGAVVSLSGQDEPAAEAAARDAVEKAS